MPLKTVGDFVRNHVINNFTAKVMALALALGLWLYAYIFSYTEYRDFQIPVIVHVGEDWSVLHGEKLQVTAKLSYPSRFEEQFKQDLGAGRIYINCNVAPEPSALDQQTVPVFPKKEPLVTSRDFSLKIMSFSPSTLQIELIRETVRMVSVLPKTSLPPPGYRVEYAFPVTAAVMIRGREDIIAQLVKTGIETEEIDISSPVPGNLHEWDMQQVPARIPSSVTIGGKSYPVTCTDQVQCHIHLTRVLVERSFTEIPIELLVPPGFPYVAALHPPSQNTTNVQVTGPKSVVDALKKENILLYVDVRDPKLVPQETPYTQPLYSQIVDEHQRPMIITDLVVKPEVTTWPVKVSDAKPR
jgi:hypothetical protein